jgi:hypothetical protein
VLIDLLEAIGKTEETQLEIEGRVISYSVYLNEIDQRYLHYLLRVMLPLLQCTAHSLLKSMQMTPLQRSPKSPLFARAQSRQFFRHDLQIIPEVKSR